MDRQKKDREGSQMDKSQQGKIASKGRGSAMKDGLTAYGRKLLASLEPPAKETPAEHNARVMPLNGSRRQEPTPRQRRPVWRASSGWISAAAFSSR
jgi:hypothetical protein